MDTLQWHDFRKRRRDPTGGERLRVFCTNCLGAVDREWGESVRSDATITLELLHETSHAGYSRPLRALESKPRHGLSANVLGGALSPACWSTVRLALRQER
ncbi:hypothetical protein IAQ61_001851 [Plenodomus lingam]|uniref:uncharacterized protein n=1 Tax=Leptosphaeria maculans TaxID=5022 RepID=UPI003317FEE6|nr:hypothetical protein IAQ61_001851 [Plenodomus lingam]